MKRRIAVFAIVWAFAFNALWVPGGLDGGYLYSVFVPAWHLFALGALVGVAHETLANRLPRLWVTLAFGALLFEAALALFANHSIGLWLAVPTGIAIALAARAARSPKLTALAPLPLAARGLALYIGLGLLNQVACVPVNWETEKKILSPDGSCRAFLYSSDGFYSSNGFSEGNRRLEFAPRYDRFGFFGATVHRDLGAVRLLHWIEPNLLEIEGNHNPEEKGSFLNLRVVTQP